MCVCVFWAANRQFCFKSKSPPGHFTPFFLSAKKKRQEGAHTPALGGGGMSAGPPLPPPGAAQVTVAQFAGAIVETVKRLRAMDIGAEELAATLGNVRALALDGRTVLAKGD